MSVATKQDETMVVDLSLVVMDADVQPREAMNHDVVTQYAEDMLAGVEFPPPVMFFDGSRYWLSQGFHRCTAAQQAGCETILAVVYNGGKQEALWDAAGSNREHDRVGMRRTNADKRRAVRMALEAKPEWSDRRIAEHVGVDKTMVLKQRPQVVENTTLQTRTGLDGKEYAIARAAECRSCGEPLDGSSPYGTRCRSCLEAAEYRRDLEERFPERTSDEGWAESRLHRDVESETAGAAPLPGQAELPITAVDESFRLEAPPAFVADEIKPAGRPTFNQTNDMVDWARWTWNPVTGCEHNCFYCYARDIANRFYPEKFKPTERRERLEAPRFTKIPASVGDEADPVAATAWRNVFVCSMADLFGRWVPQDWIDRVFDSCRKSPEWNYLFLTKFPQRYVGLDFPPTAWVGTSVDEQKRVPNAEKAFRKIKAPVKWLSIEPMLEPIRFTDMSMFDWVVIGGQSRSSGGPGSHPEWGWLCDLIADARRAGCKVYCKPNTDPDGLWARHFKQYPDAFAGS